MKKPTLNAGLLKNLSKYIVLGFVLCVLIGPFLWMVSCSFQLERALYSWPPHIIPSPFTLFNYQRAFSVFPLFRWYLNSLIVATMVAVCSVVCASMAGYTFARKQFWGKNFIFMGILGSFMIPFHIILIPLYLIVQRLQLIDTHVGIGLPFFITAFGIFFMRQYILSIPSELEDVARIDGCSEWGVLFRIVLPVAKPALVTLAVLSFLSSWNAFLWPLIMTSEMSMRTLPLGIGLFMGRKTIEWGVTMAIASSATVPILIFFIFVQRYIIEGIMGGALKG